MGEGKRRAARDANFGKAKPKKTGLVVSPPVEVQGRDIHFRSPHLDPQELRSSLLLWDKLVWPSSRAIHIKSGPDEEFLESAGILTRLEYAVDGDIAQGYVKSLMQGFLELESKEPGQWSLAQGENSLLVKDRAISPDAGTCLELLGAIPVPDKDVPLTEVLEFKERRADELQLLRSELDGFVAAIDQAEDKQAALQTHIEKIDAACADAISVSREWQFPVRLADFKTDINLRPFTATTAGAGAHTVATIADFSGTVASLMAAGVAAEVILNLRPGLQWRGLKRRLGPYRYVYQFHNELF